MGEYNCLACGFAIFFLGRGNSARSKWECQQHVRISNLRRNVAFGGGFSSFSPRVLS